MPYLFNRIDGIKESFRYLYYDDSAVKDKLVNELCHRGAGFNEIKSSDISFYSQRASQGTAASISYEVMIIPMIIALALLCMVNDSQIHSETKDHTYYVCLELIRNNEIHHYHYDFLEPYRKF